MNSGYLVDRVQTGGVSSLNLANDKVYELGNAHAVVTIRDSADLTFDVESLDVSTKMEALLLGLAPGAVTSGEEFDFNLGKPLSIVCPFRSSQNYFDTIRGLVVPHLTLQSVTYRYGLKADASQTYSFKGDSIFFTPGNAFEQEITSTGATSYSLTNTALPYLNATFGTTQHVLSMSVYYANGTFGRPINGIDYTDTSTGITFTTIPPSGAIIRLQYGSATSQTVAQAANDADGITVSPGAIRSRNIGVYLATAGVFSRWSGVQSVDCTWTVSLTPITTFGNPGAVAMDYEVADVSGTVTTKDVSVTELFRKIAQATNVDSGHVAGALSSTPVPVEFRLSDPVTGAALKTIYIPDARFEPPATQGKASTKLTTPFKFTSDTGLLYIYDGERPGSAW